MGSVLLCNIYSNTLVDGGLLFLKIHTDFTG